VKEKRGIVRKPDADAQIAPFIVGDKTGPEGLLIKAFTKTAGTTPIEGVWGKSFPPAGSKGSALGQQVPRAEPLAR
jgi:hypothetical protein